MMLIISKENKARIGYFRIVLGMQAESHKSSSYLLPLYGKKVMTFQITVITWKSAGVKRNLFNPLRPGALLQAPRQKKKLPVTFTIILRFQKCFPEPERCIPTSAPCYHPQHCIRQQPGHPHQRSKFLDEDHQEQELAHSARHRQHRGETLPAPRTTSSLHCYLSDTPHHYLYNEPPGGILSVKANVTCFSRKSSKYSQLKQVKLHRQWVDFLQTALQRSLCTWHCLCTTWSWCGDTQQSYRQHSTLYCHHSCHDAIFVIRGARAFWLL